MDQKIIKLLQKSKNESLKMILVFNNILIINVKTLILTKLYLNIKLFKIKKIKRNISIVLSSRVERMNYKKFEK